MINEDMIKRAAITAHEALLSAFPDTKEHEHLFSRRFKRKMRKLIRHTKYPIVYSILKSTACFLLVSLITAIMFLSVNVKAREAFFNWVKDTYKAFIEYYFDGMVSDDTIENNEMVEYRLGWVPEGYVESEVHISSTSNSIIIYTNDTDNSIKLNYINNPSASNLYFEESLYTHSNVTFNDNTADIYISTINNAANLIVWTYHDKNILFFISAYKDEATLIKLAENIVYESKK